MVRKEQKQVLYNVTDFTGKNPYRLSKAYASIYQVEALSNYLARQEARASLVILRYFYVLDPLLHLFREVSSL